jgi:hypothetical protein
MVSTLSAVDKHFQSLGSEGVKMEILSYEIIIYALEPEKYILARHVSVISKEGKESVVGEMARNWVGATEEYTLREENKITSL